MPVLGYLDDLVLLPLGIAWALQLIPPAVLVECRARAQEALQDRKPLQLGGRRNHCPPLAGLRRAWSGVGP